MKKETLNITHPELCKEWHPTLNGDLTPEKVTAGSDAKVWWLVNAPHPITGEMWSLPWEAYIKDRAKKGVGCPYLSKNPKAFAGFNDLGTMRPDIAAEWHPTKNGTLTPSQRTEKSNDTVWWLTYLEHPVTKQPWPIEWEGKISKRTVDGYTCKRYTETHVIKGFNDLATVRPDLAAEWHPTMNGDLTPEDVTYTANSPKRWWLKKEKAPVTGKLCDLPWEATINSRYHGRGCPYTAKSNPEVLAGFNDLASQYPEVAAEWHPTLNGDLTPDKVAYHSTQSAYWLIAGKVEQKSKVSTMVGRFKKNTGLRND